MKQSTWGEAAVPGLIVLYIIAYVVQTYELPYRTILYPYLLLGLLLVLLLIFGVKHFLIGAPMLDPEQPGERASIAGIEAGSPSQKILLFCKANSKPLSLIILTLLYPQVIKVLGVFFTTALFLSVLFRVFRTMRGALIVPAAVAVSLPLTYFLMNVLEFALPSFPFANLPFNL
jgi:hypothetical protein